MRKNNVLEFQGREARLDPLTELLRKGAQDLIGQAVESVNWPSFWRSIRTVARVMEKRPLCVMVINRNASCKPALVP